MKYSSFDLLSKEILSNTPGKGGEFVVITIDEKDEIMTPDE